MIPLPIINPPPLRTLIDEPATVVPATIPLPQVIPPPARILSSASSSLPTTVPDTLKSAPPVTDPVNVDTPATDKPVSYTHLTLPTKA